jgi:hypothetical protein
MDTVVTPNSPLPTHRCIRSAAPYFPRWRAGADMAIQHQLPEISGVFEKEYRLNITAHHVRVLRVLRVFV